MKKQFTPDDLWRFSYLSWPQVSPDGRLAAAVIRRPDENGVCQSTVRVVDVESGNTVYETAAGCHEAQPRFLPDGGLALLCDFSGEYQVWTVHNGVRTQKTTLRHGVNHYDIRGNVIAFEATLWPEEIAQNQCFLEMTAEEKAAWQAEMALRPYVAEDLTYKLDEWFGMRKGEIPRLGLCNERGQHLLPQLADTECVYPALSPDGQAVACFAYIHTGPKGRDAELAICRDDGEPPRYFAPDNVMYEPAQAPVFSPDGQYVHALAWQKFDNGYSQAIVRLNVNEEDDPQYLPDLGVETLCEGVNEMIAGRTENGENLSCFSVLPDRLLFLGGFQGKTKLFSVAPDAPEKVEAVLESYADITGFAANARGDLAVLAGASDAPADLYVNGRRLTDEHAWLSEYEMPVTEEIHIPSRDGQAELTYFYTHPIGAPKPAPAVLYIKGGPETMYTPAYWHEFHALAAAGFGVIHGNPRGSAGYGRAFREGGVCWKDEPLNDLMDMCDDAAARGWIDPARLGVTGGSYGGYLTLKLIGKTKYFAAAAGQRVFANPGTSYGTGDVGWVSAGGEIPPHFSMLNYLVDRARGSNVSRVDQIDTPLLLLHGYRDYRCTFEQAEQMFIAMKERRPDVPLRLVMFPQENHALTRTGNMKNQARHLREIVDWMIAYLQEKEEAHE